MKTSMELRMGQRGAMTPQLVQSIRLLQLSGLEMEAEAAQWLEANPMLERDEDEGDETPEEERIEIRVEDTAAPLSACEAPAGVAGSSEDDETLERQESANAAPEAIHIQLLRQLPLECANPGQLDAAFRVLECIDERGYLECDLEAIAHEHGLSLATVREALALIRALAPAGYGARNLQQCLHWQLEDQGDTPAVEVARRIVGSQLQALARHEFDRVRQELDAEPALFHEALSLVRSLDPAPGRSIAPSEHIVPDLLVSRRGDQWTLELNPHASPRLRVNAAYERLLSGCGAEGASLRQQMTEARWLLRGLAMRNDTLIKTARAIFQHQFAALVHGDAMLKPLSLRELSEMIGMHESTVSRVTQGKFVQTPRGVVELRRFFSVGLTAQAGMEASSAAVRAIVRSLVASEPAGQPLCDGQITKALAQRGIFIARRTVAKYRDQMQIPPAKMRAALMPSAVAA